MVSSVSSSERFKLPVLVSVQRDDVDMFDSWHDSNGSQILSPFTTTQGFLKYGLMGQTGGGVTSAFY